MQSTHAFSLSLEFANVFLGFSQLTFHIWMLEISKRFFVQVKPKILIHKKCSAFLVQRVQAHTQSLIYIYTYTQLHTHIDRHTHRLTRTTLFGPLRLASALCNNSVQATWIFVNYFILFLLLLICSTSCHFYGVNNYCKIVANF